MVQGSKDGHEKTKKMFKLAKYDGATLEEQSEKARNDAKKLKKKGKDLGEEMGFTVRKADKNNPIVVNFD